MPKTSPDDPSARPDAGNLVGLSLIGLALVITPFWGLFLLWLVWQAVQLV